MNHTKRPGARRTALAAVGLVTLSLLAACTTGSDDDADSTNAPVETDAPETTEAVVEDTVAETDDTTAPETTEAPESDVVDQSLTGDAPGVTDDTIKIGITYVDTEALKAVGLDFNLGEHEAVYTALVDDINANGGINGRQVEAVIVPIDPTNPAGAEAACLQLTEDEDVFLMSGYFRGDTVLCPLEVHGTAVVGGSLTPDALPRAQSPWAAWLSGSDQQAAITEEFYDRGALDGTVAVYVAADDLAAYENIVKPKLDELGVVPVEVGVMDAPTDDTAAMQNSVRLIAERFEAAGADTLLMVGLGAPNYMQVMSEDTSYRPTLLFTVTNGARAFYTSADTTDTSILEGALIGGDYGPDQARFDEATMQECVEIVTAAGLEAPAPSGFDPDDAANQPYQALFQACPDIFLIRALLERAGENLNYGTLAAAIDGLQVAIPGDPTERTYGTAPSDGSPTAYIFRWDEPTKNIVLED